MNHTPGTWSVFTKTFANIDEAVADHRRLLEAKPGFDPAAAVEVTSVVAPDNLPDPPPDTDCVVVAFLGNGPTAAANAKLIAAAPEMLKALEAIEREPYGCGFCDSGKLRSTGRALRHEDDCAFRLVHIAVAFLRGDFAVGERVFVDGDVDRIGEIERDEGPTVMIDYGEHVGRSRVEKRRVDRVPAPKNGGGA